MNIKGEYLKINETTFKKLRQNKIKGLKVVNSLILIANQIIITYTDNTLTRTDYTMDEFTINNTSYQLKYLNTSIYKVVLKNQ